MAGTRGAWNERVGLLKGLAVAKLDEAAKCIRYMPGGATLVATMKKHGGRCALVSGGFTHFTALVHKALGFQSVGVIQSCGWKFGRWLDIVLMEKPLGDADRTAPAAE